MENNNTGGNLYFSSQNNKVGASRHAANPGALSNIQFEGANSGPRMSPARANYEKMVKARRASPPQTQQI